MVSQMVAALVSVIIGVILITGLATTITTNTDTGAGSELENVSASAKSLYGLFDFVWAAGGLILVVVGLFGLATSFKRR